MIPIMWSGSIRHWVVLAGAVIPSVHSLKNDTKFYQPLHFLDVSTSYEQQNFAHPKYHCLYYITFKIWSLVMHSCLLAAQWCLCFGRKHYKFQCWCISWFRHSSELLESCFREVWKHVLLERKGNILLFNLAVNNKIAYS